MNNAELLGAAARCLRSVSRVVLPLRCPVCGQLLRGDEPHVCRRCAETIERVGEPRCPACGKTLVSELGTCMRCRGRAWSFDLARPLYPYRGAAAALISAYKFQGRRSLADYFVDDLASEIRAFPGACIVPVPYRRKKIVERGWDQVEELVRRLESRGFPARRVLERLPSGEQKKLGLEERFANARTAYRLRPGSAAPEAAILLDDVFTTGATADACATALRDGGSRFVVFLALAAD